MLVAQLNRTRRIGIELEMTCARVGRGGGMDVQQTIAEILTANDLPAVARSYSHEPVPQGIDFCVEYDGSVSGPQTWRGVSHHSLEIKSRPLAGFADFEAKVSKLVSICNFMNCRVNATAGFHVHLDLEREVGEDARYIKSLLNVWFRFERVLFGVVAPSRSSCGYAQPIPDLRAKWNRCRAMRCFKSALAGWDRRTTLNANHLFDESGPRVEVRLHQGTLEFSKIRHWVVAMNRILDHASLRSCQVPKEQVINDRRGIEKFLTTVGFKSHPGIYPTLDPEVRAAGKYLLGRWKRFNGNIALKPSKPISGSTPSQS